MKNSLCLLVLALSACATQPKPPTAVTASALTVSAPPTAKPGIDIAVTVLSTRLVPLARAVVEDMHRLDKDGSVLMNIVPNESLGQYRLDAQSDTLLVSHVYVRTGIPDTAYLVVAKWKAYDAEAGERALQHIIQNLPVTP